MSDITNTNIGEGENVIKLDKDIKTVGIVNEMKTSYLDYAMSVIVSRALPDVRDGLKPVHRRILFSMYENGFDHTKSFKKSARIVGDVMGKYHPHGDSAIYESLVRMTQDFSLRVPLIEGQGNFGSMDGDGAAAMRYTESRLNRVASTLLEDLDKDTVDFRPNYDESFKEPVTLPARFPNLLVNGGGGIAVGMATNIPTHNLGEVLNACIALSENSDLSVEDLMQYVVAPDFPTGGIILGLSGVRKAFMTGRGSIVIRGKTHFEEIKSRTAIVITEIPYQVNKKLMIEKFAELVKEKVIEGISDIRDESDRQGVRVVVELKKDAVPDVVLNQLFKYTPLQSSFGVNMLAINKGRPEIMNLKTILQYFIEFREEVIRRRVTFDLNKARTKAHTQVGLAIAVANLDPVIKLIREAKNPDEAKAELMARDWEAGFVAPLIELIDDPESKIINGKYKLSAEQAKAILDLRLQKLTGLEREKLSEEIQELGRFIKECLDILANRERVYQIMRDEFIEIRDKFATPRKTTIEYSEYEADIEDLIAKEDMVVTVTNTGYVKRVPLSVYRAQKRGGKGRNGMTTKEEDFVVDVFVANTHTPMLFFSNTGMAYKMKVYKIPEGSPTSKGKAFINLLPLAQGEVITTVMPLPEDENTWDNLSIMFATKKGTVRRNKLSAFTEVRANGKIAMKFEGEDADDALVSVKVCDDTQNIMLATKNGKCINFNVSEIRVFASRASTGVRGIKLLSGDEVISMTILNGSDADAATRAAYLKKSKALRGVIDDEEASDDVDADTSVPEITISDEKFAEMQKNEQFMLTVTDGGFGKKTSSYEYRTTHRGGSGITNIKLNKKSSGVVSLFPILDHQQIILVTDAGKLIRIPTDSIRIAGRMTQGVILFKIADDEKVVSVAVVDADEDDDGNDNNEANSNNISNNNNPNNNEINISENNNSDFSDNFSEKNQVNVSNKSEIIDDKTDTLTKNTEPVDLSNDFDNKASLSDTLNSSENKNDEKIENISENKSENNNSDEFDLFKENSDKKDKDDKKEDKADDSGMFDLFS